MSALNKHDKEHFQRQFSSWDMLTYAKNFLLLGHNLSRNMLHGIQLVSIRACVMRLHVSNTYKN